MPKGSTIIQHYCMMTKSPRQTQTKRNSFAESVERHFGIDSDNFDSNHFSKVNQFIEDNHKYFILLKTQMTTNLTQEINDHELVDSVDAQTLINLVKFLRRGTAPGSDTIHNVVLGLGTTTSLFYHLAWLFTSSIQLGCIPAAGKLATLQMLLKPDKLPSLTASYTCPSALSVQLLNYSKR